MKSAKIVLLLGALVLAGLASVPAADYENLLNLTTNCPPSSTNTITKNVDVRNWAEASFQVSVLGTNTGTGNITVPILGSADGVAYNTGTNWAITVPINGTNRSTVWTNITLGSVGFLRLPNVTQLGTNGNVSVTVKVTGKPNRQGSP
jgi:hypothetical protein